MKDTRLWVLFITFPDGTKAVSMRPHVGGGCAAFVFRSMRKWHPEYKLRLKRTTMLERAKTYAEIRPDEVSR